MRWTIRRKLIALISIPLLVTYLLILAWDYHSQRESDTLSMQRVMLTRAKLTAGMINTKLEQAEDLARAIANRQAEDLARGAAGNAGNRVAAFEPMSEPVRPAVLPQSDWAAVGLVAMERPLLQMTASTRSRGYMIRRVGRMARHLDLPEGLDFHAPDQVWYANVLQSGTAGWFGPMHVPGLALSEVCIYATPVKVGEEIRGVAAVLVPPMAFRSVGDPTVKLLEGQGEKGAATQPLEMASLLAAKLNDFVVVSPHGQVIYRPLAEGTFREVFNDPSRRTSELVEGFAKAVAGESSVVLAEHLGMSIPGYRQDEDYWAAFVPIPATGWVFGTAVSETEVMRPMLAQMAQRAVLMLAGLILMLLCVYSVSVRLSTPIERLAKAIRRVGEGDLETQVPVQRSYDEVAELASGFNAMVGQIRVQMDHIRQAAVAKEKAEGELRIARKIQSDLLPREFPPFPDRKEFSLHAVNQPAEHVAGDFYDFFFVDERRLMLVIADVSGKGVPAAILMAVTRTIVRNLAMMGKGPLEIVKHTNQALVDDSAAEMFVTMIVCEYDTATGEMVYVNGGHCPPVVMAADGEARAITGTNSPLVGASVEWPAELFVEARLQLEKGETLVMYTDGVTEARNADGEMLEERGLRAMLKKCSGLGPEQICKELTAAGNLYQLHQPADDLTLVVLRRET